jgi:hypothetical protein
MLAPWPSITLWIAHLNHTYDEPLSKATVTEAARNAAARRHGCYLESRSSPGAVPQARRPDLLIMTDDQVTIRNDNESWGITHFWYLYRNLFGVACPFFYALIQNAYEVIWNQFLNIGLL